MGNFATAISNLENEQATTVQPVESPIIKNDRPQLYGTVDKNTGPSSGSFADAIAKLEDKDASISPSQNNNPFKINPTVLEQLADKEEYSPKDASSQYGGAFRLDTDSGTSVLSEEALDTFREKEDPEVVAKLREPYIAFLKGKE